MNESIDTAAFFVVVAMNAYLVYQIRQIWIRIQNLEGAEQADWSAWHEGGRLS